jgi:hypothetical protein
LSVYFDLSPRGMVASCSLLKAERKSWTLVPKR